jgi:predicted transcriptional regulator
MGMVRKRGETTREPSREEDAETLAAIQRGIRDSEEGRVTSIDDVRKSVSKWTSKSSSQTKR